SLADPILLRGPVLRRDCSYLHSPTGDGFSERATGTRRGAEGPGLPTRRDARRAPIAGLGRPRTCAVRSHLGDLRRGRLARQFLRREPAAARGPRRSTWRAGVGQPVTVLAASRLDPEC